MTERDIPDTAFSVSIAAARIVMAAHLEALNAQDPDALAATMHFPHYRLSGGVMRVWQGPTTYLAAFHTRASGDWHRTEWDSVDVLMASPVKVHLDVRFTRFRADGSILAKHRSLWVISEIANVWAAQLRSSFAP